MLAGHVLRTGDTVRATAKIFSLGKSTVHKELTKSLKKIDYPLYLKIQAVLDEHSATRHLRGGEATKNKYLRLKNAKK
jgi:putative DeoR family transcriptional regulator (stage III sporulation protein D)